jgi:hypothetical protein
LTEQKVDSLNAKTLSAGAPSDCGRTRQFEVDVGQPYAEGTHENFCERGRFAHVPTGSHGATYPRVPFGDGEAKGVAFPDQLSREWIIETQCIAGKTH